MLLRGLSALAGAREVPGLGVWEWRPGAAELSWSCELYRVLGHERGRFRPTPQACRALRHPDDVPVAQAFEDAVRRACEGDVDASAAETFRVYGADGAVRHLQAWAAATPDAAGELVVHGAAVDVTDRPVTGCCSSGSRHGRRDRPR